MRPCGSGWSRGEVHDQYAFVFDNGQDISEFGIEPYGTTSWLDLGKDGMGRRQRGVTGEINLRLGRKPANIVRISIGNEERRF